MNKAQRNLRPNATPAPGTPLSKAALRLLAALAVPKAAARPDPTRDGMMIVTTVRAGISLGQGAHAAAAASELSRHDLVTANGAGGYTVSDAGRAYLRRRDAGPLDAPFRAQQMEVVATRVEEDGRREAILVNAAESPLDWLVRRRDRTGEPLIDTASYQAGERLRRDLTMGGVLPGVTARWDAGAGGGGLRDPAAATDAMVAARQRVSAALATVGSDFADLLIDLCGFLKGLEQIERERRWPARSGKVVVRLALARLAEHYGLRVVARGPAASRGIQSWHAPVQPVEGKGAAATSAGR